MPVQVDSVADLEAVLAADLIEPSEVEGAYNAAVAEVSQAEAEAGVATSTRRWTALRVAQAAAAQIVAIVTAGFIRALGFFDVTNDGAGSGLDADLLDGQEAAAFAAATHAASHTNGTDDIQDATVVQKGLATAAQITKLDGIEAGATADQSDVEIETAYNNQVSKVSAGEITAGTEVAVRRYSPADVKSFIDTHAGGGGDLSAADIDTLAELNAILTDATLIDTTDARLSDERTPLNNSATNAKLADVAQDTIKGRVSVGAGDPEDLTAAQVRTLLNVEDGATADQTNAEIETAYNAQVAAASQAEMEAGTEPGIRRVSPLLVAQAIAALASGGSPNAFLVTRKVVAASGNSSGMGLYRITGASVILTFTSADIADTLFTCAIKNENGSDATLATEGAETIEGLASMTLQSGFSVWLYSDGTNLRQIAQ